jgi:hypothetical protein
MRRPSRSYSVLGIADVTTTLRLHAHVSSPHRSKAASAMDWLFGDVRGHLQFSRL